MEVSIWLLCGKLANVERNMKIQRVGAIARDLDVLSAEAEALKRHGGFERDFGLVSTNKNKHLEMLLVKKIKPLGLDILVIDKDIIDFHVDPLQIMAEHNGKRGRE